MYQIDEVNNMSKQKWMIQALVLGTVFFLAAWIVKPVGVSTQFSILSGKMYQAVDSSLIQENPTREHGYQSSNAYYDKEEGKLAEEIMHPITYDFVFVLAIPLGGFIAYLFSKKKRKTEETSEKSSCPLEERRQGMLRTYGVSFLGGVLLLYGARMAGGCTSGHMMSGMMQGAVSGYAFAAAVFAVAIPVAIYRGRKGGRR